MRNTKGVHLSVPMPCHEKWGNMSETGKGRFCQSCEKEVVDFSSYTDEQILAHFSESSGPQCGRFHPIQLNKTIIPIRNIDRPSALKLLFGSLLAILGFKQADAQEKAKPTIVNQLDNEEVNQPLSEVNQSNPTIRGKIIDKEQENRYLVLR